MPKFRIYPKRGQSFTVEFERFEYHGDAFTFYDSDGNESHEGLVVPQNISAIVPDVSEAANYPTDAVYFEVYLQNRSEDEEGLSYIVANQVDITHPPSLRFYRLEENQDGQIVPVQMSGIYIAISEVVAVFPSAGLRARKPFDLLRE
jgi:hypothetical protein